MSRLGQFTCETVGAVQTDSTSHFLIQTFFPTDFEFVFKNIAGRIRDRMSIWDTFKHLGLFADSLRLFLRDYVSVSAAKKVGILEANKDWWQKEIKAVQSYVTRYNDADLSIYLDIFTQIARENQVPASMLKPYTYVYEKKSVLDILPSLPSATGVTFNKMIVLAVGIAGAYAFASGGYKHLIKVK